MSANDKPGTAAAHIDSIQALIAELEPLSQGNGVVAVDAAQLRELLSIAQRWCDVSSSIWEVERARQH